MPRPKGHFPIPRPGQPTLAEVLRRAIASALLDVHTALPCKVVKFDPGSDTQQATVDCQIMVRHAVPTADEWGSVNEDYPIVQFVPVGWYATKRASMQMRLAKGDTGLLVFSEAAIGIWRTTGGALSDPGDLTRHDISYPVFLPVLRPDDRALPTLAEGEGVAIDSEDAIRIGGPSAAPVALAAAVFAELGKIATAINALPGGSYVAPASADLIGTTKLKGE